MSTNKIYYNIKKKNINKKKFSVIIIKIRERKYEK